MKPTTHQLRHAFIGLALSIVLTAPCGATERDWNSLEPLSDARLATLRGGFVAANGLRLSFSMERVVFVNGELTASTRLTIPDLANLSARGASLSSTGGLPGGTAMPVTGASQLITNGQVVSLPNTTAMITGIQNSLNNQLIQVRTTIDATLASMSQFRTQLINDAFRQSTIDSIRR